MKDLRLFTGATEIGWLRVDSISGEGNLTVMETYKLNDRLASFSPEDGNYALKVEIASNFMKIPKTFGDIIEFATDNSLTLLKQDQNSTEFIVGGTVITATSPLTAGTNAVAYAGATITTTGSSGNVNFSIPTGSLPTGLVINATTGVISGTPTVAGTYVFTVNVLDNEYSVAVEKQFTIVIA